MHPGARNFLLFLILVFFYCLFLAISALVMIKVERPFEDEWRDNLRKLKAKLTRDGKVNSEQLEDLISEVEFGQLHGYSGSGDMSHDPGWTFGTSLLYVTSIGTTVGYGHLAPGTDLGKVLTAIFTSISVPLTLLLTTVMVIRLLRFTRKFRLDLEDRIGDRLGLFKTRLLHLVMVFTCVLSFFVIIVALIFRETEPEWNMFEALYFSIISVSTVGLGDYVPGYSVYGFSRQVYLVFCSVFLVVGVVFALLVLETMYEIPELGIHVYLLPADDSEGKKRGIEEGKETAFSDQQLEEGSKVKLIEKDENTPSYGVK